MKMVLAVVAFMVATITGWGMHFDWSMIDPPNASEEDLIVCSSYYRIPSDFDIDTAINNVANAAGNEYSAGLFNTLSDGNKTIDYSEIEVAYNGADSYNALDKYAYKAGFSSVTMVASTAIHDSATGKYFLDKYLIVNFDKNDEPVPTTWKSFQAVPEPASGLLIVMGSVLLAFRRKVA